MLLIVVGHCGSLLRWAQRHGESVSRIAFLEVRRQTCLRWGGANRHGDCSYSTSVIQVPIVGQGVVMKRILFVLLALGLFSAGIAGCRVAGEVGDTASIAAPR